MNIYLDKNNFKGEHLLIAQVYTCTKKLFDRTKFIADDGCCNLYFSYLKKFLFTCSRSDKRETTPSAISLLSSAVSGQGYKVALYLINKKKKNTYSVGVVQLTL